MTLHQLPAEIIIQILKSCTLTTLLSLRLAHPWFCSLASYHINQIAPTVAWNTFPTGTPLLHLSPDGGNYSIQWLKSLYPLYMATVIVDRHRYGLARLDVCWSKDTDLPGPGIPAWDGFGDALRRRVVAGLRVLKTLSNISADLYRLSDAQVEKKVCFTQESSKNLHTPDTEKPESLNSLALLKYRELLILRNRENFLKKAPQQAILDYVLTLRLLESTFLSAFDQWETLLGTFDRDDAPYGDVCDLTVSLRFCQDNSWLNWFILNQGPDLFWQQWCPSEATALAQTTVIRDGLLQAFNSRDPQQIIIERNAALRVKNILQRLLVATDVMTCESRGDHKLSTATSRLFYRYHMRHRHSVRYRNKVITEEGLDHIPYFIDLQVDAKGDYETAVFGHLRTVRPFVTLSITP